MPWLQVTLPTDRDRAPLIEAALESAGALALTMSDAGDEPQLEPPLGATPLWSRVRVTALFPADPDTLGRVEGLAESLSDHLAGEPQFERLADQPWERAWLDDFAPARFGRRLWVCPRGQPAGDPGAVVVQLDPGLAFGTGHHPTTALCLRWLDDAELTGKTVLDYGCGSGILAIAALRLGAARAVAVDHDPQALEATRANAAENGVGARLLACVPGEQPPLHPDVLLANILAGPLVDLAPGFGTAVLPGGLLALSGILADQAAEVAAAYKTDFVLDAPRLDGDWVLLSGRRR